MFLYTEKYTESEYDIQDNNLLYKIHQKHQNTYEQTQIARNFRKQSDNFEKLKKKSTFYLIVYINSIIHIL